MAEPFPPKNPFLAGFEAPCRFEGKVHDLIVHGKIPKELHGTFYRVMPDPAYSPTYYEDGTHFVPFDGDGNVSAFHIKDGHVDFQQAYVETERLKTERAARKSLWGKYRNPYTAHPCVRAMVESVANTNIVFYGGKLLALKENGLPYSMDPKTLKTIGYEDFGGQISSKTFTAHPKFDPKTGEMVCWGYEAKGNGTRDCCYFALKDGKKTEELWFESPYCGFIHDAGMTDDYLVLMLCPLVTSLERLKRLETHWVFDYTLNVHFGVVPRRGGDPSKVRWFEWKNAFPSHVANATQVEGPNGKNIVQIDAVLAYGNILGFFPEQNNPGKPIKPEEMKIQIARWDLDLSKPVEDGKSSADDPTVLFDCASEFPRIDDRFVSRPVRYIFCGAAVEVEPGMKSLVGTGGLNAFAMIDLKTRKNQICRVGANTSVQEPVFVPRSKSAPEGDGFVIGLVNRLDQMLCDLVVIDTTKFEEPIAVINVGQRLRQGLHGNWVDASEME